jgi:hypothetical protein
MNKTIKNIFRMFIVFLVMGMCTLENVVSVIEVDASLQNIMTCAASTQLSKWRGGSLKNAQVDGNCVFWVEGVFPSGGTCPEMRLVDLKTAESRQTYLDRFLNDLNATIESIKKYTSHVRGYFPFTDDRTSSDREYFLKSRNIYAIVAKTADGATTTICGFLWNGRDKTWKIITLPGKKLATFAQAVTILNGESYEGTGIQWNNYPSLMALSKAMKLTKARATLLSGVEITADDLEKIALLTKNITCEFDGTNYEVKACDRTIAVANGIMFSSGNVVDVESTLESKLSANVDSTLYSGNVMFYNLTTPFADKRK